MTTSYYYEPLTQIMAAPYDGQPMPSGYCAQVRENLMALYTGESFRVHQSVAQTSGFIFLWDTVDWATPNVDTSQKSSGATPGLINVPNGIWLVGMDAQGSWGTYREMRGGAFLNIAGFGDWKETQSGATYGLMVKTTLSLGFQVISDGTAITTSVATYNPYFWGIQLRDYS